MEDLIQKSLVEAVDGQFKLVCRFLDDFYGKTYGINVAESRATALMHEACEVSELFLKSSVYSETLDRDHVKQELGDVMFNVQAVANAMGFTLAECIEAANESVRNKLKV